jgi:hypothetical protein
VSDVGKTIHMCIDVRGALRNFKAREWRGCTHDDGRAMSPEEVRDYFLDCLAKGWRVVPFGQPCEGFDYLEGCPGHPTPIAPKHELPEWAQPQLNRA